MSRFVINLCSFQPNFQLAIVTENMIPDIVYHLFSDNVDIKLESASAIYKCSVNKIASEMVRQSHGLEQLVTIIKDKNIRDDKPLLAATTGAIWKCSIASKENKKQLDNVFIAKNIDNFLIMFLFSQSKISIHIFYILASHFKYFNTIAYRRQ